MYQHILAAVDLGDDMLPVAKRARALSAQFGARLSFMHVVEPLPVDTATDTVLPPPMPLEEELVNNAEEKLKTLRGELSCPDARIIAPVGYTRHEIVDYADKEKVDLIVVGSHNRHGLAILLGSTARSVLSHSPCDVLAVKMQEAS